MNRRITIPVLVAATVALVALAPARAQSPNPQAVAMYNLALKAYKEGSTDSAVIFFKRAAEIDPNLADAHYNLGIILQTQRRLKEALPRFQEVLRVKPSDPDAHYQLGIIYQELGRPAEAKYHFSNIAPSNPHFPDAQQRIAALNSQPAGSAQQTSPPGYPPAQAQPPQQSYAGHSSPLQGAQAAPQQGTAATPAAPTQTAYLDSYGDGPSGSGARSQPYGAADAGHYTAQSSGTYSAPAQSYAPQPTAPVQAQAAPQADSAQATAAAAASSQTAASPNPVPVLANTSLRVVGTGFSAPTGLAFDRLGNLYVANYKANTIERISPDGTRTQFSSGSNLRGPVGVVVDDHNNVYVANYLGGNVARISPAGVSTIIATGFKQPYYLTLDSEGNLYVSQQEDNSIVRITLPRPIGSKPQ